LGQYGILHCGIISALKTSNLGVWAFGDTQPAIVNSNVLAKTCLLAKQLLLEVDILKNIIYPP
jgi:hypothetical protein